MGEKERQTAKDKTAESKNPCQVVFTIDDQVRKGSSFHFHERGMLVMCEQPAPLSARLKVRLEFPTLKNPIELKAEVVWTNIHGPHDSLTPRGMGIKFLEAEA